MSPSYLDPSLAIAVEHGSEVARRQDAIGAIMWRALRPDASPRTEILVPPMAWSPHPADAQAVLTAAATMINAGMARPRPLPQVIIEADAVAPQPVAPMPDTNLGDPRGRFDDAVVSGIAAVMGRLWGLTAALTTDERTGLTGYGYTAPLREDSLRALSQSVPPDARNGLAQQRLTTVGRTVDDLFNAVTIVNPGGSYTLATERSPLPLALRNNLPVPIRVRLDVDAPPGMTVTDMGVIELPPGFLPLKVPIEVHFTQRVAVDVALRTADGLSLGEPVRLSVHSNAYGKVLFFITLTGGAILALLVGRRLWHRFRGQPDRADLDRPDPLESHCASTPTGTPTGSSGIAGSTGTHGPSAGAGRAQGGTAADAAAPGPAAWNPAAGPPPTAAAAPPPPRLPRGPAPAPRRTPRTFGRRGGVPLVGHGVRNPDQPAHRIRPHRADRHHPRCRTVQRLLGGLPTPQPDRRAGAGGDVHRDLRARARPRRTRRSRRRHGIRAPSGHAGDDAAGAHHRTGRRVGAAAGRADARRRPLVNRELTTAFAYLLLPQVLFYGLSSVFMAILNTRNVFGPPAWAPVCNNIVAIATLGLYLVVPGELSVDPVEMGNAKLLVLGIGMTLGTVTQVVVLLVALRRERVSLRPLWGIDDRLKQFGAMASAMVLYVLISQIGLIVGNRIASGAAASGPAIYNYTWLVLMLPFGMIGVTVLTVVMPRLSRNAAANDNPAVLADLSLATRLTMVTLIPIVAMMTVGGPAIGSALFSYGNFGDVDAGYLGMAITLSAFTLIPYALVLLQLRVFYAREQPWTPIALIVVITVVKIAASVAAPHLTDDPDMVAGYLGMANGLGFLAGATVGYYLLRANLNPPGGRLIGLQVVRTILVTICASLIAGLIAHVVDQLLGLESLTRNWGGGGSLLRLLVLGLIMAPIIVGVLLAARVPEAQAALAAVRRRLGRGEGRLPGHRQSCPTSLRRAGPSRTLIRGIRPCQGVGRARRSCGADPRRGLPGTGWGKDQR